MLYQLRRNRCVNSRLRGFVRADALLESAGLTASAELTPTTPAHKYPVPAFDELDEDNEQVCNFLGHACNC
jgi:hypothetical protein